MTKEQYVRARVLKYVARDAEVVAAPFGVRQPWDFRQEITNIVLDAFDDAYQSWDAR